MSDSFFDAHDMTRRELLQLLGTAGAGTVMTGSLTGLTCVLLFLLFGFEPWSVGIGVFLGFPLLLGGIGLYVAGVVRDLRHREVL